MAAFGIGATLAQDTAQPPLRARASRRTAFKADAAIGLDKPVPILLVGAGAGDAGDLTLRAYRALQTADIIFYDDLVDDSILELIPASVEVVFVGKRAGKLSADQNHIHALMTEAAERGLRVVRLKGGDPFVFGRGSEEADALNAAGFESEIVPGLTAALVCAASAGIPLTDRRHAAQVTFITATRSNGELNVLRGLAGEGRTLVIYMGARLSQRIARALLDDAVSAAIPVALIENGGRASQRVVETTVGALADDTAQFAATGPALLIVGDVIRARIQTARAPFQRDQFET